MPELCHKIIRLKPIISPDIGGGCRPHQRTSPSPSNRLTEPLPPTRIVPPIQGVPATKYCWCACSYGLDLTGRLSAILETWRVLESKEESCRSHFSLNLKSSHAPFRILLLPLESQFCPFSTPSLTLPSVCVSSSPSTVLGAAEASPSQYTQCRQYSRR
jgi:hypothetical protein